MSESATVIKEIQAKFTANITDYRNKMGQLMSTMSNMTKNLDAVKRTAASAMNSPSASTQKLGRSLDATASKLQKQRDQFTNLSKAGERTAQQMEQLTQRLAGMANTYSAIKSASASFDLSTPLQKQADAAKAAVEQIDVKIESLSAAMKNVGKDKFVFLDSGEMLTLDQAWAKLEQLSQSGVEAATKFDRLKAAIDGIGTENLSYASAKGMDRLKSKIGSTADQLNGLGDKLSSTSSRAQGMTDSMQSTKRSMDGQSRSLSKSTRLLNSLKNAFGKVGGAARNGLASVRDRIAGVGSAAKNSTYSVNGLWKAIKKIAVIGFTLKLTKTILGRLRTTLHDYLESNEAAAASVQKLRDGLAQALAPAINVVINLLNRVMPYLIGIADAVASLITNIFGTGWTTVSTGVSSATNSAKDSADKASKSAGKASDKVDDLADSTKKAAEKQKEYNKLIAGFDEITKLEDQDSSDNSDKDKTPKDGSGKDSGSGAKQKTAPGTEGIAGKLPAWLDAVAEKLAGIWDVFQQAWAKKGKEVTDAAKAALEAVLAVAKDVGETFYDVFTDGTGLTWVESCLDLLKSMLDVVKSLAKTFKNAWDSDGRGRRNVRALFTMLTNVNDLAGDILESFAKVWDKSGLGESIWGNILDTITGIYDTIGNFAGQIDKAWNTSKIGEGIWKGILGIIDTITGFVKKIAEDTADWAKHLNFVPILKSIKKLLETVKPIIQDVADAAEKVYKNFILPFGSFVIEKAIPDTLNAIADALDAIHKNAGIKDLLIGVGVGIAAIAAAVMIAKFISKLSAFASGISALKDSVSGASGWIGKLKEIGDFFRGTGDTTKTVKVRFKKEGNTTLESLIGDKMTATVTFKKASSQTLSKIIGGDRMDAIVTFKKAHGQTLEKLIGTACSAVVTFHKKQGQSLSKLIGTNCTATVTFRKKPGQTLNSLIGSSCTATVNFRAGSSFGGGHGGSSFGGGHGSIWDDLANLHIDIPHFANGGVVDKPTYALAGDDGPEAFVPLKNNAEWTGVVANLITRRMSTMPTYDSGTSAAAGSTSNNQNDLLEMLMLVRELRADVAALKSNGIRNSVTVYTQLDGTTVAKNTINHINRQSRVTGKNPLGSYI